ncbi:MAG: glycosyl hydrolase [Microbacterium sp.]
MRPGRRVLPLCLCLLLLAGCTAAPAPSPTASTPVAAPTPTEPAQDVRIAAAAGKISGWSTASPTAVGEVAPAVGTVADGRVAVLVDAPSATAGTTVLKATASVVGGETYTFGGSFRSLSAAVGEGDVSVEIDGTTIPVPAMTARANWQDVAGEFVAADDATEATVTVSVNAPLRRIAIDDLSLTGADGTQVLPNPSFEKVKPAALLANSSLTMSTDFATLAVGAAAGKVTYRLKRPDGTVALSGSATVEGALEGIALTGVTQGYYTLTLTDADGEKAKAAIGVVDTPAYDIPLDPRFGTLIHVENTHYTGQVRYASTLGLGMVGSDVLWRLNETEKGVYDWDKRYDREFARLRASGMELGATIDYGNTLWGDAQVPSGSAAIGAYARYAAAVAKRYHPEAIEIFNEFNSDRFNAAGCGTTADCYLTLVKSVSKKVRKVDADITLLAGATANYDSAWFERLWKLGGLTYVDAMSFHPYSANSRPDRVGSLIADAQKVSAEYGDDALPVWITETGSSSKTGGRTLAGQGEFLLAMESSELATGAERVRWYDLKNGTNDRTVHERNFGLFEYEPRENTAALSLKPAAYAQALLVATVEGRAVSDPPETDSGVVVRTFGSEGDRRYVVWTPDGSAKTATIPSTVSLTMAGVSGQQTVVDPVDGEVTIDVTEAPVLLTPIEPRQR